MPDFVSNLDSDMNNVPTAADVFAMDIPVPPRRTPVDAAALKDALVRREDNSMMFRGFKLMSTGLVVEGEVDEQDWVDLGNILKLLQGRLQWLIGDWALSLERQWGQTYAEIAAFLGYEVKTVREWTYVCRNVDLSIRMDELTFAHHQIVAGLAPGSQKHWLGRAAAEGLSVAAMRQQISQVLPKPANDPPTLFAQEHVDLLRDMQKLVKNERKLAKTSPSALRAYAAELERFAQAMREYANAKGQ